MKAKNKDQQCSKITTWTSFFKEQKLKELVNSNPQKVPDVGFIRKF